MTGRYVLAWASGATCGLLVGWVYGSHVQRLTEAHRLAGVAVRVPEPLIPAQRDDEPCQQRSPGGGLVCCRKGHHTAHLFEGSHARDRKADADERIE